MKTSASLLLGLLATLSLVAGQHNNAADEAALKAIEAKWDAASVKGDVAALGALFADSFVSTSSEGQLRTKPEMLARIKSGEVKYQTSKVDDLKISVYGDAAVVTGRWTGKFVENGKAKDESERFTDTFIRQNGQWRCVASHGSPIK